jgi:hypothetical protein
MLFGMASPQKTPLDYWQSDVPFHDKAGKFSRGNSRRI